MSRDLTQVAYWYPNWGMERHGWHNCYSLNDQKFFLGMEFLDREKSLTSPYMSTFFTMGDGQTHKIPMRTESREGNSVARPSILKERRTGLLSSCQEGWGIYLCYAKDTY